jgi:acyl-coenzyme A synthetase/AMP-(fatty) acid ligase
MNVVARILHFATTRADEAALVEGDRSVTFGELAGLVCRTACHMAALGLSRGGRIGLCLKDTSNHVIALLAAARLGAVPVPLDCRARPAENARFIDALGLNYVLAEPDARLPGDCRVISLDDQWHRQVSRAHGEVDGSVDWNDPFIISATSGSTGAPKFTLMTHLQYHFATAGMFELMALTGRHRFLCALPLYYSGGRNSCLAHLLRGDCVVLYPSLFSPAEYVNVIARQRITVATVVPSVVRQLLAIAGDDALLPGLAALFCTGAPLYVPEKRRAVRALTPNFHERYGTAETLALSILRPADFAHRAESVGQPHSLVEIEVVDDSDRPLAHGSSGRLRIRGPGVGTPLPGQATEANFHGGWYYPGEIACLNAAGYIFLQGRTSDVIIRNGAKIFPAEIESTLGEHPGVLEAAVLGHRGPDNEEIVVAFVVSDPKLAAGELLAHCRTRLTPHKIPRQFHFLAQLPRNTAGKVDKAALARLLDG